MYTSGSSWSRFIGSRVFRAATLALAVTGCPSAPPSKEIHAAAAAATAPARADADASPEEVIQGDGGPADVATRRVAARDAGRTAEAEPDADTASGLHRGGLFFRENDRRYYLLALDSTAPPFAFSDALDRISKGADEAAGISRNGKYVALVGHRFGCSDGNCVILASGDGSRAALVEHAGQIARGFARPAVSEGGDVIVVPSRGGPHSLDLFALTRDGDQWSAPLLLTKASRSKFNQEPAISPDGRQIAFDCGDDPYSIHATSLCRVRTDGAGFEIVLKPTDLPGGKRGNAIHHPAWDASSGLVFEADSKGEQVWRLASGSKSPAQVASTFGNDNTPCAFTDGRVGSLWLGRVGNESSAHELKVMAASGAPHAIFLPGLDVLDVGLDCVDEIAGGSPPK